MNRTFQVTGLLWPRLVSLTLRLQLHGPIYRTDSFVSGENEGLRHCVNLKAIR